MGATTPAATNAPTAKTGKKKSAPKKKSGKKSGKQSGKRAPRRPALAPASTLKTVPLVPGPAAVVADHVNVRGQPKLHSEVLGHLTKGQQVMVLEEITFNESAPDEPSAWAKIAIPPGTQVWVNSLYINPSNKTVKATRLNMRSGPGQNFSVIGRLEHGETVKDITTKGDWMEIEPPTNAFAFVAAQFLKQEQAAPSAPAMAATATPAPPETAAAVAPPPTSPPATENPTAPAVETPPAADTNVTTAATAPPTAAPAPAEEPPPPRIIQHEGLVHGITSIQAPSHFSLVSPDNGKTIDYLYSTNKDLDLRRFKGLRVIATGPESLDERWGHTPVLTVLDMRVQSEPPPFTETPPTTTPAPR